MNLIGGCRFQGSCIYLTISWKCLPLKVAAAKQWPQCLETQEWWLGPESRTLSNFVKVWQAISRCLKVRKVYLSPSCIAICPMGGMTGRSLFTVNPIWSFLTDASMIVMEAYELWPQLLIFRSYDLCSIDLSQYPTPYNCEFPGWMVPRDFLLVPLVPT